MPFGLIPDLAFGIAGIPNYSWLITQGSPYRAAWEQYECAPDLSALIAAVSRNYATGPAYANVIESIAGQRNVLQAIGQAAGEKGPLTAA